MRRELSSLRSASVSMMGPRATLTMSAPSFMVAKRWALNMWRDESVRGKIKTTISSWGRCLSKSSIFTVPSRPDWVKAVIDTSKPASLRATSFPIDPKPIMPTLLSESDGKRRWFQVPTPCSRINSAKPRRDAIASPTASSAVDAS